MKRQILGSRRSAGVKPVGLTGKAAADPGLAYRIETATGPSAGAAGGVMKISARAVDGVVKRSGHLARVEETRKPLGRGPMPPEPPTVCRAPADPTCPHLPVRLRFRDQAA